MSFDEEYRRLIVLVKDDLARFDEFFRHVFNQKTSEYNPVLPIIKEFLSNKGKQLRPVMTMIMAKALGQDCNDILFKIAAANEIIHNATLIHDDIIDCSILRRGKKTLNFEYDSKLAVLAGDYLLSIAMKLINSFENNQLKNIHIQTISLLINGELSQYFNRFKLLTIEDYIEKSKNKTARLFEACLVSVGMNSCCPESQLNNIRDFALNFGIAFQIMNDLDNLQDEKKIYEDIQNGDYSAPVIYYAQEKESDLFTLNKNARLLVNQLKKSGAIEKTQKLANFYLDKAIENISFIEDNLYKQCLIDLCNLYKQKNG